MDQRLLSLKRLPGLMGLDSAGGFSTVILAVTAGYLTVGLLSLAVWIVTQKDVWIVDFFYMPGAALLVTLAGTGLVLSLQVVSEFAPGQFMRKAWQLIAVAAAFDFVGSLASQILGTESPLNPLRLLPGWSPSVAAIIHACGFVLGGTCRFTFLAAGLFWTLRVYRQSGFLGRLAAVDWCALALVAAYVIREASDLIVALEAGKHPTATEIMGWPVDPLLWLLLLEALLLYRSVRQTGIGWIGRCWRAFSIGIALVTLGDIALWAFNYGFLPWPWVALEWYIWLPAAGAFAVAPAYQLEAIDQARKAPGRVLRTSNLSGGNIGMINPG